MSIAISSFNLSKSFWLIRKCLGDINLTYTLGFSPESTESNKQHNTNMNAIIDYQWDYYYILYNILIVVVVVVVVMNGSSIIHHYHQ